MEVCQQLEESTARNGDVMSPCKKVDFISEKTPLQLWHVFKYIYISWYGRIARHMQCLNKNVIGTWDVFIYDFSPKSFKNSLTIHELNNQSQPPKSVTCLCFKGPAKHSLLPRGGILFQSRECAADYILLLWYSLIENFILISILSL